MASLAQAEEAVQHGASSITHLFNAMPSVSPSRTSRTLPGRSSRIGAECATRPPGGGTVSLPLLFFSLSPAPAQFHHRDPGIVGLLTSDQVSAGRAVYYGMIADGIHTNPAALRMAHRAHPSGGRGRASVGRPPALFEAA